VSKDFRFHYVVYELASMVEGSADAPYSFVEINWKAPPVIKSLCRFSKNSILHYYIFVTTAVYFRRDYRKNADSYEEDEIAEIEDLFQTYGVKLTSYEEFYERRKTKLDEADQVFYQWFSSQEGQFEELWETMTFEVFQLLFANRAFLLTFNQSLSEYLRGRAVSIPRKYLNKSGRIKRDSHIPSWLKKAVYFRDHGRCVLCQKDLTGLISVDQALHYDHIVPLHQWGINDPCNIQLLCDKCNLQKSGESAITGISYPSWW
jgi:hypothetical protein